MRIALKSILFFLFLSPVVWGQGDSVYNEIFNSNGKTRAHYREVLDVYNRMTPEARDRFVSESVKLFHGDNAMDPLPRVISQSEYQELSSGVKQRGDALAMFLKDHYSGAKKYSKAGIIPEEVVERIISRSYEQGYAGKLNPNAVAFTYGPDLIRASDGKFYVIEDNPGYVGGFGDIILARDVLGKLNPEYSKILQKQVSPEKFYKALIDRYKARSTARDGKIVIYSDPEMSADWEDKRVNNLYREMGVEVVHPKTKSKRLVTKDDGVYLETTRKGAPLKLEKVGFVIVGGEYSFLDISHPVPRKQALWEDMQQLIADKDLTPATRREFRRLLDQGFEKASLAEIEAVMNRSNIVFNYSEGRANGLTKAALEGKVAVNNSPGVDFIGDKEFYTYVEDLIRFYLKQEPMIRNLPTERFSAKDADLFRRVFDQGEIKSLVIKKVDGRGGSEVWIGPKLSGEEISQLRLQIEKDPSSFIAQKYQKISQVFDSIVDLRLLAQVDQMGTIVSPVPWARGNAASGSGKVNLSGNGREYAVLIVDDESMVSCLKRELNLP